MKETSDFNSIVIPLHFVYILVCHDGTLYTGYTNNLMRRLSVHNKKQGARYTKSRLPVYLVYHEVFLEKRQALQREYALKGLSRSQKLALIQTQIFCMLSWSDWFSNLRFCTSTFLLDASFSLPIPE